MGQSFAVFADGVGELFGEGRADVFFAAGDLTDGVYFFVYSPLELD